MSNVKYSEKDMAALIGEVETQFADHLKKAEKETEPTLAKSEEISEEVKEVSNESSQEVPVIEKSEKIDLNYDNEDFAEMDKLYIGMNKAEAKAHYQSVKKALYGEEIEKSEEAENKAVKIEKSEIEIKVETEKNEDFIAKSEFEAVKEENGKLKKSIEDLTNAVKGFNKGRAPKQKAITQIKYLKKSEVEEVPVEEKIDVSNLTKSEIAKKLSTAVRKGADVNDREKIKQYYMDNTSIDTIKHLL